MKLFSTLLLVSTIILLMPPAAGAQEHRPQPAVDTSTTAPLDSVQHDSTSVPVIPIPSLGSIDRELNPLLVTRDSVMRFLEYRSMYEIIRWLPGLVIRDPGSPGQYSGITIQGSEEQGAAILSDGILLNDPLTGRFNLNLFPPGNTERIEYVPGTRAFLHGTNSGGGVLNFVSNSRRAIHPYSRLRYSESTHDFGFVDAVASQDIVRGLNLTLGVAHPTFKGEFANTEYDHWNMRGKIRYDLSNELNIFASGMYAHLEVGLHGGIKIPTADSLGIEGLRAQSRNTDAYEKLTRHDMQLGAAARLASDPNAVSSLTFYLSSNLREYRDEENRIGSNGIFIQQDHQTQLLGAKFTHDRRVGDQQLQLGGEVQERSVIASPTTGQHRTTQLSSFGRVGFRLEDLVSLSPYARLDHTADYQTLSAGADGSLGLIPWVTIFGGFSDSYRFPTFQERYWSDSLINPLTGDAPPERHHVFELGVRSHNQSGVSLLFSFFHRIIEHAYRLEQIQSAPDRYTYTSGTRITRQGFTLNEQSRTGWLATDASVQYLNEGGDTDVQRLPRWNVIGGVYYWDTLFGAHLTLKTGFRGRYFSKYGGVGYDQQRTLFLPDDRLTISSAAVLDFLLIARLGDAHVHLLWENLLNREYITTIFYPMPDRSIRFGIDWEFLD